MFFGTHDNKIDRKGRVSVPAPFRSKFGDPGGNAIVAFPSFKDQAIEVWTVERMQQLQNSMDQMDQFSQEQSDLASLIFADSRLLNLDAEGRVMLPADLTEHAGITDKALFVGQGATFQIWEPGVYREYKAAVRERAARGGHTIRLAPPPAAGS